MWVDGEYEKFENYRIKRINQSNGLHIHNDKSQKENKRHFDKYLKSSFM